MAMPQCNPNPPTDNERRLIEAALAIEFYYTFRSASKAAQEVRGELWHSIEAVRLEREREKGGKEKG